MLPLQQAYEVKESILEFIHSTYRFKEEEVGKAFYEFLEDPRHGMIKGPYISLKGPFVSAPEGFRIPLEIKPGFPPYKHQIQAFEQLTTDDGHVPRNTLITTGTGSGKTECFLFPVLDYCYKHIGEKGIKVIILYPMNALATDQAKRLAEAIYGDDRLRGNVTAGLFIGKGLDKKDFSQVMTEHGIIEDARQIVANPPDIILTNFKMLDYGIMRGENASLWEKNIQNPGLLKYIILDELHTYDGAQGTDVANLLRRLKLRIGIDHGSVCGVGTSATIGSGEESKQLLCDYASDIFGETFLPEDVIEEHRVPSNELFAGPADQYLPGQRALDKLTMKDDEKHDAYIRRQMELWSVYADEAEEKGLAITETLSSYQITRDLFSICEETGIIEADDLLSLLSSRNPAFSRLEEKYKTEVLESLLALLAEAKIKSGKILIPFLPLQVQLWVRELSGIRRIVDSSPRFTWRSDMATADSPEAALPMYYCRECGASGWIATKSDMLTKFDTDGSAAAKEFMARTPNVWLINTYAPEHKPDASSDFDVLQERIKKDTLDFVPHLDPDDSQLEVYACRRIERSQTGKNRSSHFCPECATNFDDLSIIGARTATLASLSVSQLLSSNLDKATDRERKILTFTNGVQDAAHLSGFYTSREYRFTMRASIQKVIELLEKEGSDVNLLSIFERFKQYWKAECQSTRAYLYRFFPNDYAGEIDLRKDFQIRDGVYRDSFLEEFDLRVFWEIISEFGLLTSFGRSLERTSSSASYFMKEDIDAAYEAMKPWLNIYMKGLVTQESFEHFMIGFLERSLLHGAISHPFLEEYRKTLKISDLNWWYSGKHFLNRRFGKRATLPQPLIVYKTERNIADNAYTERSGWYFSYYTRCFNLALPNVNISNDFYRELVAVLVRVGIFDKVDGREGPNYCINPEKIHISTKVRFYRCDHCQSALITSDTDVLSKDTPCIIRNCQGSYTQEEIHGTDYYQMIYRREKTPRIYSHEHTGLLGRKQREEIEADFKLRPNADSINSLVATSTLEMGIDIGDLNSELNVGIPPLTANYLQRVGRAGRKSGGALIIDFAKSDPHDLYFFEEPKAMMAGEVNTPGCYLNAKDILRRHFYAYCIDSWTAADPKLHTIPHTMRVIKPDTNFLASPDFFINRISQFIQEKIESLESSFSRHYSQETYENVLVPMFEQFSDGSFEKQVEFIFERMRQEYLSLTQKIIAINNDITQRRLSPNDDEYKELIQQKNMLYRQRTAMKKRIVLEFMTDEGLLPNYAFPETGVTLSASILGSVPKGEDPGKQAEIKEFEIVRPASAGLKDLAPGNHFYFDGLNMTVNGINTADWNSEYGLIRKRFCARCDCIEDESPNHPMTCPKCGDPSFGSDDHVHTFVNLRNVKVNEKLIDAILDDSTDEREKVGYKSTFHFKFNPGSSAVSYGMKDIPFGIEFVKSVSIFETNLGETSVMNANNAEICRNKVPMHGFVTCRYCGKSVSNPSLEQMKSEDEQKKAFHYPFCKHKDKLYADKADEYFEQAFLSREFHTEAIKILLPVQEIDSDATTAMFKAGLNLGLKYYFRGNPQHIAMREYFEFNQSTGKFDNYVVLYDTIPGGTGYLAKLFDTVEFSKVLRIAYERLDSCQCQHEGKDGCYHCVLSYENKYTRGQLSRSKAAELFKRIVDKSDNWETINGSIGTVTRGGGIEESELETRFITSLREICEARTDWKFSVESALVTYYKIEVVGTNGETRVYTIMPQVSLGPANGVEFNTRPDFFLQCVKRTKDGADLSLDSVPRIALYLDGYAYHGSSQNGKIRFFDDFRKREAIHRSGDIITWTMSWEDIDNYNDHKEDSLFIPGVERNPVFWNNSKNGWKHCINDYERFLSVLTGLDEKRFSLQNLLYLLSWSKGNRCEDWKGFLAFDHDAIPSDGVDSFVKSEAPKNSSWCETRIAILPDQTCQYSIKVTDVGVDIDKDSWRHFWRLYNLLNLSTVDMFDLEPDIALDIEAVIANFDPAVEDMVRLLIQKGIDFDHDGEFTLTGEDGTAIANAQLGVESLKLVIDPYGDECRDVFIQHEYTVLYPGEIDKLKEIIGG